MADEDSPLIKALPPETDYLTYLTIIEYNLSPESLPILHKVLQDETIATNIGWDLVHLLEPFLPESEQCLDDIARLGNPREVILKVTESLRLINYDAADDFDSQEGPAVSGAEDARKRAGSSTYPLKTAPAAGSGQAEGSSQATELPPPLPLPTIQFINLLSMLGTLHERIKAKSPSRFLSTTLQAVLASFSNSTSDREEMILAIVLLIKSLAGAGRPALPNRQSSGMLKSSARLTSEKSASDPEASTPSETTPEERAMQQRLLQSFVTHVMEEYMLNLEPTDVDVPGMAWCSRIMETLHPERNIPQTKTFADRFASQQSLNRRIGAIGQLVTVAKDLKLADDELLNAAITVESVPDRGEGDEEEPPASAQDIPLSRLGSLLLYTARQAGGILYESSRPYSTAPFAIFPDHHEIIKHCLSSAEQGTGRLGTEPESLIDAVLAVAIVALERDSIGQPSSDEQYNEYLQLTALLSSNCPSPNMRGHAHFVTSTILRSHPDESMRLAFIRDTLENCPFENLKVSAVGWIKSETIEANARTPLPGHQANQSAKHGETSIFATPLALASLAPFLFPSLKLELVTAPISEAWITFRTNLSFYLATLNFLYLLLCAKHLHHNLSIQDLWTNNDVAGSFLQPLKEANERFKKEMEGEGELVSEKSDEVLAELNVLDAAVERVTAAVRYLNEP
jgi:hypothetical protein